MLGMRDGGDVIGAVAMSLRFGAEGGRRTSATTPGGVCWAV